MTASEAATNLMRNCARSQTEEEQHRWDCQSFTEGVLCIRAHGGEAGFLSLLDSGQSRFDLLYLELEQFVN